MLKQVWWGNHQEKMSISLREREEEYKSYHFPFIRNPKNDLLPRRINVYTKIISNFLIKIYLAYMHITQNLAWMMEQILVI